MNDNTTPTNNDATDNNSIVTNEDVTPVYPPAPASDSADSVAPASITATAITKEQLNSIGIDLPDDEMAALIEHTEDTINERIGEEIVDSLDDDQLEELANMQDQNLPAEQIEQWIVDRVKDYQEIIEDNVTIVLGELAESVEKIQGE